MHRAQAQPLTAPPTFPIHDTDVRHWLAKGRAASEPLLAHAGAAAHPGPVGTRVAVLEDAVLGGFMPCWPEDLGATRVIHHLPDAGFFLALLERAYSPVLAKRPELRSLLYDGSRVEIAFTNDVLQAQLRGEWQPYSMIRHHALMLFHGLLWLDEPARAGWAALYQAVAEYTVSRPGGAPPPGRLADVEAAAFADFERLAARTRDPVEAAALLGDERELAAVLEYQLLASAAVYVLWREHQSQSEQRRLSWQHRELAHGYGRPNYLTWRWAALLTPALLDSAGGPR
jgi:hypothetical protein